MKVNSEIFRAYDIRGIVDEALTEEGIFKIGKAIGSYILSEGRSSILTARDGRISGPRLLNQLLEQMRIIFQYDRSTEIFLFLLGFRMLSLLQKLLGRSAGYELKHVHWLPLILQSFHQTR